MEFFFDVIGFFLWLSMMGVILLLAVGYYALTCLGRMQLFKKAGVEGYKAWIPFYRDYELCRITMGRGWYFIFGFIPVISFFMRGVYALEVMLSYGQNLLFGVLYFCFPTVAELVAGFGGARYRGSQDLEKQIRDMLDGNGGNWNSSAGANSARTDGNGVSPERDDVKTESDAASHDPCGAAEGRTQDCGNDGQAASGRDAE